MGQFCPTLRKRGETTSKLLKSESGPATSDDQPDLKRYDSTKSTKGPNENPAVIASAIPGKQRIVTAEELPSQIEVRKLEDAVTKSDSHGTDTVTALAPTPVVEPAGSAALMAMEVGVAVPAEALNEVAETKPVSDEHDGQEHVLIHYLVNQSEEGKTKKGNQLTDDQADHPGSQPFIKGLDMSGDEEIREDLTDTSSNQFQDSVQGETGSTTSASDVEREKRENELIHETMRSTSESIANSEVTSVVTSQESFQSAVEGEIEVLTEANEKNEAPIVPEVSVEPPSDAGTSVSDESKHEDTKDVPKKELEFPDEELLTPSPTPTNEELLKDESNIAPEPEKNAENLDEKVKEVEEKLRDIPANKLVPEPELNVSLEPDENVGGCGKREDQSNLLLSSCIVAEEDFSVDILSETEIPENKTDVTQDEVRSIPVTEEDLVKDVDSPSNAEKIIKSPEDETNLVAEIKRPEGEDNQPVETDKSEKTPNDPHQMHSEPTLIEAKEHTMEDSNH